MFSWQIALLFPVPLALQFLPLMMECISLPNDVRVALAGTILWEVMGFEI
jgi:hypothetical protein